MKKLKKFSLVLAFLLAAPAWAQDKMIPVPPSGSVTLTLEEYNRLVELAGRPPKHIEAAPLPYSIKRAALKFKVADDKAMGAIQLQGETFAKGETRVALGSGITILDARQEGKNLPLEQESGTQTAILNGPAEFSVTLDVGLPLNIETGRASMSLPVPPAGSAQLTLEVPGDHTNVHVNPGLITGRTSANGVTTIEATLVPGQPASLSWATREVVAPVVPREVRFLSNVKTLVSVSEADIRLAVLADINVVQGEPAQFEIAIPEGYEVTGTTGASVDTSEVQSGMLTLKVNSPAQRTQEFLISLEKETSSTKADVPFLSVKNAQSETGEVLVEGVGTMELTATEGGSLKRMDFKETNPYLRSLARATMQAAFRYHRGATETPKLALEWTRFPDSSVLAAVAERAVVTTLVTNEGRSLTEVRLTMKNQAQPFLKVELPQGASIVSADVAGEKVKPVEGSDGNRVPLLRPGLRPNGDYEISFVFMHSGTPFAKKGGSEISLPKMDVPIGILQWEVFLPEQYKVKDFGGDAISANLVPPPYSVMEVNGAPVPGAGGVYQREIAPAPMPPPPPPAAPLLSGQIGGYLVDPSGAVIANAQVSVTQLDIGATRTAVTDDSGHWVVSGLPSGRIQIRTNARGFQSEIRTLQYDANSPTSLSFGLSVASTSQTVTVMADTADMQTQSHRIERDLKKQQQAAQNAASQNVFNLQQRVAGVLPVRFDVPRAGRSYRFVRPLVLDEETRVTFSYKTK
jgi:Carboxypeptidase regulatory-like domain